MSDPNDIRPLGNIRDNESLVLDAPLDIFVDGDLAYVTSKVEQGVQILDVSDPNDIRPLGNIRDNESLVLGRPLSLFVLDGLAYVTSSDLKKPSYEDHETGVQVLDVSDPNDIRPLGNIRDNESLVLGGSNIRFVLDGLAYVVSYSESGVQILDVSAPNDIRPLGNIRDNESLVLGRPLSPFCFGWLGLCN